jgi:hypothetical protein
LVILRDHGRLLPKPGFFAQMSQTAATGNSLDVWTFEVRARSASTDRRPEETRATEEE